VESVDAVQMSDGKLFHAVWPVTQNARLPKWSLVQGTTRSPRAAEWTAARVGTDINLDMHDNYVYFVPGSLCDSLLAEKISCLKICVMQVHVLPSSK